MPRPERPELHLVVGLGLAPGVRLPGIGKGDRPTRDRGTPISEVAHPPSGHFPRGDGTTYPRPGAAEIRSRAPQVRSELSPLPPGEGQDEGDASLDPARSTGAERAEEHSRRALLAAVCAAAEHGIDWVQVRDHQAFARDLFDLAQDIVKVCRPLGVRVAVNDRLDVALATGADAVQLGTRSLPIGAARAIAGRLLMGASVHDVEGAVRAEAAGADWVTFGHVFPTASHPGEPPRGLDELRRVVEAVRIPVVAIGGVDAANVGAVLKTGAAGVAVISAILNAADPGRATTVLRRALDQTASC
jgi:thiamine-phosphate diphosphorylase